MTTSTKMQGNLDGLCGMYAIVNAVSKFDKELVAEDIFSRLCKALPQSRWPEVLWDGTTLRDLEMMIKCLEDKLEAKGIMVRYPFRTNQPTSDEKFWVKFDALFHENRSSKCAIVGLEEPALHWVVVEPRKKTLLFIDSDNTSSRRYIQRRQIYAGQRRNDGQKFRLDRKEVILFEKIT